jgi:hypothetical protein
VSRPSASGARASGPATPGRQPAIRRPAGTGQDASTPHIPQGVLAGTVRGPVAVDTVRRRFAGPRILGVATVAAIVGAPVLVARAHQARHGELRTWLLATEAYALLLLAGLWLAGRRRGTVVGDLAYSARVFLPRRRGIPPRTSPEYSTEAHRFKVETIHGDRHACALLGRPAGGRITDGDFVHVHGRRARSGEVDVARVQILSSANGVPTAGVVPDRRDRFRAARTVHRVSLAFALVLVAGFAAGAVMVW